MWWDRRQTRSPESDIVTIFCMFFLKRSISDNDDDKKTALTPRCHKKTQRFLYVIAELDSGLLNILSSSTITTKNTFFSH